MHSFFSDKYQPKEACSWKIKPDPISILEEPLKSLKQKRMNNDLIPLKKFSGKDKRQTN